MTRKIKSLGLAFVAIAAMSMVVAGGAQASELHATTPNTATIIGNQTVAHEFKVDAGTIKCQQALIKGIAHNAGQSQTQTTTQDLTVTAQYTNCLFGGLAATVNMNGCKYTITGAGQAALTAQVDITGCTAGKVIEVKSFSCTVTVAEQHNLSHITFQNTPLATPHDVHAKVAINNITYQTHGTCPNTASDHTSQTTTGQYTGESTFQARVYAGTETKTHNGHEFQTPKQQGALVGLIAT